MSRPRKILKKLGISLVTLLVLGVAGELVARALEPGPFSLLDHSPYRPHPELHHVHQPGFEGRWDGSWYSIDSRGLRGQELALDFSPDEYRVVCLGDSCTFGKGVREDQAWPRQLERLLAQEAQGRFTPIVANLGLNGYSGRDYVTMLREKGLELRPQLVVVGYNLNDFPNAIKAVDESVYGKRGLRRMLPTGLRDWMGRFALYRLARASYYHLNRERDWRNAERFAREAGEAALDSQVWQTQREHLAAIRDETARVGGQVAVFLFPYESQVHLEAYEKTPIERLQAICHELDVPFVDLAQEFRRRVREAEPAASLFLMGDRYHPSAAGYRIVAERVLALVRDQGWLPE